MAGPVWDIVIVVQFAAAVAVTAQDSVEFVEVAAAGGWCAEAAEVDLVGVEMASAGYSSVAEEGMSAAQHD